jgi:hypothetical protein
VYTSLIQLGGCNESGSYGLGMFVGFGYKVLVTKPLGRRRFQKPRRKWDDRGFENRETNSGIGRKNLAQDRA